MPSKTTSSTNVREELIKRSLDETVAQYMTLCFDPKHRFSSPVQTFNTLLLIASQHVINVSPESKKMIEEIVNNAQNAQNYDELRGYIEELCAKMYPYIFRLNVKVNTISVKFKSLPPSTANEVLLGIANEIIRQLYNTAVFDENIEVVTEKFVKLRDITLKLLRSIQNTTLYQYMKSIGLDENYVMKPCESELPVQCFLEIQSRLLEVVEFIATHMNARF